MLVQFDRIQNLSLLLAWPFDTALIALTVILCRPWLSNPHRPTTFQMDFVAVLDVERSAKNQDR